MRSRTERSACLRARSGPLGIESNLIAVATSYCCHSVTAPHAFVFRPTQIFIINEKSEVTSQRGVKLLGFREDVAPSSSGEKATGKGKAAKGKAAKPSGYNSILEIADNIFPPLTHRDLTSCLSPSSPFARSSSEPAGEDIEAGGGIASGGGGGGGGGSGDGGGEVGTAGDLLPDGSPLSPNGRQQPSNHSVLPEPEVAHEDYNSFNYWRYAEQHHWSAFCCSWPELTLLHARPDV